MRTLFESQLNADQYQAYQQLYNDNLRYKKYFIEENRGQRTIMEWLFSRGTNYTCYIQYLYSLNEEQKIENTIDKIKTVVYAIHKPFQFTFFYWTILIFVLYKFNFKNKVLKIISAHLLFRSLGDILDKFGDLYPRYFSNKYTDQLMHDSNHIECSYEVTSPEHYPFRWFLTRQIGCTFWLMGEIVADWYSLIRTREIVKSKKTIWYVYATCGLFNFSKIALIFHHWFFFITKIYDENGVYNNEEFGKFYNVYWVMQLIIIYASLFYDISVYYVLKKYSFQISISGVSFVKKFKTYSTYRIYVTALVSAIFLPMISLTIFARLYYYYVLKLKNLDFSFEEIKISITNLQYFIIFIDQILLSYSNENSDSSKKSNKSNKSNNSTSSYSKNSLTKKIRSPNENNSIKTLINNQSELLEYNYYKYNHSNNDHNSYSNSSPICGSSSPIYGSSSPIYSNSSPSYSYLDHNNNNIYNTYNQGYSYHGHNNNNNNNIYNQHKYSSSYSYSSNFSKKSRNQNPYY